MEKWLCLVVKIWSSTYIGVFHKTSKQLTSSVLGILRGSCIFVLLFLQDTPATVGISQWCTFIARLGQVTVCILSRDDCHLVDLQHTNREMSLWAQNTQTGRCHYGYITHNIQTGRCHDGPLTQQGDVNLDLQHTTGRCHSGPVTHKQGDVYKLSHSRSKYHSVSKVERRKRSNFFLLKKSMLHTLNILSVIYL